MREEDSLPNVRDIRNLVGYLDLFEEEGFSPIRETGGGQRDANDHLYMYYPVYSLLVRKFINEISDGIWMDYDCNPSIQEALIQDARFIHSASLKDIKSLLTYCIRAEKYSEGNMAKMINAGYIKNILLRLEQIRLNMR